MSTVTLNPDQHAELMRFAFNQIAPKGDWKGPIDCIVPWDLANLYMQAITFMTATVPTHYPPSPGEGHCRLTSPGYRMGPAGP